MRGNSGKNHWRWKGGLVEQCCEQCGKAFVSKPAATRKYCSRDCTYAAVRGVPNRNSQWKGDKASYKTLHAWVIRWRGKPSKCEECGTTDDSKWYDWANISKQYRRELSDWKRLCRSCHRKFDGSALKGAETKRLRREKIYAQTTT